MTLGNHFVSLGLKSLTYKMRVLSGRVAPRCLTAQSGRSSPAGVSGVCMSACPRVCVHVRVGRVGARAGLGPALWPPRPPGCSLSLTLRGPPPLRLLRTRPSLDLHTPRPLAEGLSSPLFMGGNGGTERVVTCSRIPSAPQ